MRIRSLSAFTVAVAIGISMLAGAPTANAAPVTDPIPWSSGDPTFTPISSRPSIVGANYHGMWTENTEPIRAKILDRLAGAGVTNVRLDVSWDSLQPTSAGSYDMAGGVARLDTRLNEIAARGMTATVMLYWAPRWATAEGTGGKSDEPTAPNYQKYGQALGWAAHRWRAQAPYWEMWNEPDLTNFWKTPNTSEFANLIKAAYPIAKAASPTTTFVLGAPTYLGLATNWFAGLYAAGIKGNYDAIGIHPYMSAANLPPEGNATGTSRKWSIAGIQDLRALMATHNDASTPLWATEFGWSAHANTGNEAPWKRGVTEGQQAQFTLRAFQLLAEQGVQAAHVYTDKDMNNSDLHEASYGLLRRDSDISPKSAYFALRCAAANICGPGGVVDPPPNPPATPKGLNITATSATSARLQWSPSSGATSYDVYRGTAKVGTTSAKSFLIGSLVPNTRYSATVVAVGPTGRSPHSLAATFMTRPRVVSGLTARATSSTSVSLTWNAVAGATSYLVYRNGALIVRPSVNRYLDSGLTPGKTYRYVVKATNGTTNSTESAAAVLSLAAVSAKPLATPQRVRVARLNSRVVVVSWQRVPGAVSYRVVRFMRGKAAVLANTRGLRLVNRWSPAQAHPHFRVQAIGTTGKASFFSRAVR